MVFGTMLITCVLLLVMKSVKGAFERRRDAIVCCVTIGVASLIAVNAFVDFSLQIQAVTLTFMAILGAGVAQSQSSQIDLCD